MKKLKLLLITIIICFIWIINVEADITVNGALGTGQSSDNCNTNICASTIRGYYGLNVKLYNSNNEKIAEKDLTNSTFNFTTPNTCNAGQLNFCWSNYFAADNKNNLRTDIDNMLKAINSNYSISNSSDKYLIVQPLLGIDFYINNDNYTKHTYFYGTHVEITNAMNSAGSYVKDANGKELTNNKDWGDPKGTVNKLGQGFIKKDSSGNCGEGCKIGGEWNILRNYFTSFKLSSNIGNYTNTYSDENGTSALGFANGYNTSRYGKIAIKISDFLNQVQVKYLANGGIVNDNDYKLSSTKLSIFKIETNTNTFHTFKHGANEDPYNASTFGLTKAGYTFGGWKVVSTGEILNQNTEYPSTTYAQHDDSTKTSANTSLVTCHLEAVWIPHTLTVKYYNGATYLDKREYGYATAYSNGLLNYSTLGITKDNYTASGLWVTSDEKYSVGENESFLSGQALAQALGKDLSSSNQTVNVYAKWVPHFSIYKTTTKGTKITSSVAKFKIYNSYDNCVNDLNGTEISTTSGRAIVRKKAGTYWIKETQAPDGFIATSGCTHINIGYSVEDNQKSIKNKSQCEYDFEQDSSVKNRLYLYKNKYAGFRNLLDFTITDSTIACSTYNPDYNSEESCLYANKVVNTTNGDKEISFDSKNLSTYNEIINIEGQTGYCLTNYTYRDYYITSLGINFKDNTAIPIVKAGQMVLKLPSEDDVTFAESSLTKKCYIYKYNNNPISEISVNGLQNYVNKITLENLNIYSANRDTFTLVYLENESNSNDNFYVYEGELLVQHSIENKDSIYVSKINGKICNTQDDPGCVNLGPGIISKFEDANTNESNYTETKSIIFKITPAQNSIFEFNDENHCKYKVVPEIIKYTKNINGNLDLEFRTIDTNNPFNRNTNSNWCDGNDCSKGNNIVITYIKNRNNSYNKDSKEPMYEITLTPSDIKIIRNYNKDNSYDNYAYSSDVNMNSFIYGLKHGTVATYESTTPIQIEHYGDISNNLIINK